MGMTMSTRQDEMDDDSITSEDSEDEMNEYVTRAEFNQKVEELNEKVEEFNETVEEFSEDIIGLWQDVHLLNEANRANRANRANERNHREEVNLPDTTMQSGMHHQTHALKW